MLSLLYRFIRSVCRLNVFLPLYAILILVSLKTLVIFLILGLWNVKMAAHLLVFRFWFVCLCFLLQLPFQIRYELWGEVIITRYGEYCAPFSFRISQGEW